MSEREKFRNESITAWKKSTAWGGHHRLLSASILGFFILIYTLGPLVARQILGSAAVEKKEHESDNLVRKRAEWYFRPRATLNGHVPTGLRLQALAQNEKMIREEGTFLDRFAPNPAAIAPQLNSWTALGPQPLANQVNFGNVSGRVNSIAVDPCDATGNTVYVGGADGGVWVSFNALSGTSATWKPLTDSQPSLGTGAIALDSTSCATFNGHMQSKVIYDGTGEENFNGDALYGAGVLRSTDGGQTWSQDLTFTKSASQSPFESGPFVGALAVQPGQPTPVLLAALQGTSNQIHSGVWRSTDGGKNWTRVLPSGVATQPFMPATDVLFDPADSSGQTAYAALGDPGGDGSNSTCTAPPCNGVYKSSDAGLTWNRTTGLDGVATPSRFGRISLAISPGVSPSASKLFVAIADANGISSDLLGLFTGTGTATNGSGGTWVHLSTAPNFCTPQCFFDMKVAVVPGTNGQTIFLGGSAVGAQATSVNRSTDAGNTWHDVTSDGSVNGTILHVDAHAFAFTPDNMKIYVGNDGGVWFSPDVVNPATIAGNQHWTDLNTNSGTPNTSLGLTQFYPGMSISPISDSVIYGGSQDNGTQQFKGNLGWSDTEACGDGAFTAIDQQTPTTIYAGCADFGSSFTVNKNILNGVPGVNGVNWVSIQNGINISDNADFIPPLVIDSKSSKNLYFGTFRVYQTVNSGTNWKAISPDLTSGGGNASGGPFITAITVAPSDSNTVYVGTVDGLVWVTSNALSTATFTRIDTSALPGRTVTAIGVNPQNPKEAYVTYSGFSCPGTSGCDGLGHIFFTMNSGAAWTKVDGNVPDIPVNDIVVDPIDATGNTVYIGTDAGVYASSNATAGSGTSWSVLKAGLPNSQVLSLKLRETSRMLVAGTHGRSAWNLLLQSPVDFSFGTASPTTNTVTAGGSAVYTLPISPVGGAVGSAVSLSCASAPVQTTITCTFSKNPFTPGVDGASVTVTVHTVMRAAAPGLPKNIPQSPSERGVWLALVALLAFTLLVLTAKASRQRRIPVGLACAGLLVLLGVISACGGNGGGGGGGGTPANTYTITISGTAGNFNHAAPGVQLVVN